MHNVILFILQNWWDYSD